MVDPPEVSSIDKDGPPRTNCADSVVLLLVSEYCCGAGRSFRWVKYHDFTFFYQICIGNPIIKFRKYGFRGG